MGERREKNSGNLCQSAGFLASGLLRPSWRSLPVWRRSTSPPEPSRPLAPPAVQEPRRRGFSLASAGSAFGISASRTCRAISDGSGCLLERLGILGLYAWDALAVKILFVALDRTLYWDNNWDRDEPNITTIMTQVS